MINNLKQDKRREEKINGSAWDDNRVTKEAHQDTLKILFGLHRATQQTVLKRSPRRFSDVGNYGIVVIVRTDTNLLCW